MCGDHDAPPAPRTGDALAPPDWTTLPLPPAHVLAHYYDCVPLGGLASMATVVDDQDRVAALAAERGWAASDWAGSSSRARVVACFGYHPWFVHRYCLAPTSRAEHYRAVLLPARATPDLCALLDELLPFLPDPLPLGPLLDKLRADISRSLAQGRLTMLGEVGLDGQARVRWPRAAEAQWRAYRARQSKGGRAGGAQGAGAGGADGGGGTGARDDAQPAQPTPVPSASAQTAAEGSAPPWKPLTPFRTSLAHQRAVLSAQLELAVALGVNVSLHSVAASGATLDVLASAARAPGFAAINVDLHSCGGMSAQSLAHAQRTLPNLYASPSVLVTARGADAAAVVRAVDRERVLVESDSHDARLTARLVWAAVVWVARCRGWRLEGVERDEDGAEGGAKGGDVGAEGGSEDWVMDREEEDEYDAKGRRKVVPDAQVWTVRQLERNWARFMRLVD